MLLQQLKRVAVEFDPLGPGARPAREVLARCLGPKARASNPRCKVEHVLSDGRAPARVAVEFGGGEALRARNRRPSLLRIGPRPPAPPPNPPHPTLPLPTPSPPPLPYPSRHRGPARPCLPGLLG